MTTYRLTEHHTAGGMSRTLPHLAELQPEFFCEISPELAAERDIEPGGWLTIMTMRGIVEARAHGDCLACDRSVSTARRSIRSACPITGDRAAS